MTNLLLILQIMKLQGVDLQEATRIVMKASKTIKS